MPESHGLRKFACFGPLVIVVNELKSVRAILFDLDDTLTDRARSIERVARSFLDRFRSSLPACTSHDLLCAIHAGDGNGYASREALASHLLAHLPWRDPPALRQLVDFWRDTFPRCNVERRGARDVLQSFHHQGLRLGIVSNGFSHSQRTKIEVLGITSLLSVVLISEEVNVKKPDRRIFQMALDELNVLPDETLFVGDNPQLDVAPAVAMGMRAIRLNVDGATPPHGAFSIRSLAEVAQFAR